MKSYLNLPKCLLLPLGTGCDNGAYANSTSVKLESCTKGMPLLCSIAEIPIICVITNGSYIKPSFVFKLRFSGVLSGECINIFFKKLILLIHFLLSAFDYGHYVDPGNNGQRLY